MKRRRTSLILLGICVIAVIASSVRLIRQDLPAGSSFSTQPDGAQALYEWAAALGGSPKRLLQPSPGEPRPGLLVVLQPEAPLPPDDRDAFDEVLNNGGTLVLAGDSPATVGYARSLGVRMEPAETAFAGYTSDDEPVPLTSHLRLSAPGSETLLRARNGDVLALRKRHEGGSVIVLTSVEPLTNLGLHDEPSARFVYREVLEPVGSSVAFDEAHHSFVPPAEQGTTLNQLAFDTAPGRAILYAIALVFVFLFLSGRRVGPPLPERAPTETRRTMFEHVQMLAGLHRRAGHLAMVRSALARHYARALQRGTLPPAPAARVSAALPRVEGARSEADLLAAVAAAETP